MKHVIIIEENVQLIIAHLVSSGYNIKGDVDYFNNFNTGFIGVDFGKIVHISEPRPGQKVKHMSDFINNKDENQNIVFLKDKSINIFMSEFTLRGQKNAIEAKQHGAYPISLFPREGDLLSVMALKDTDVEVGTLISFKYYDVTHKEQISLSVHSMFKVCKFDDLQHGLELDSQVVDVL